MAKNHFVLTQHGQDARLPHPRACRSTILTQGYGMESRGVMVSYQAQSPVLGLVLPSNSPGVHTLWLPVIPLQIGLVLKPGPQEPWTPYRMTAAFIAGRHSRAKPFRIYPGGPKSARRCWQHCTRAMIFGGTATVERYKGNPRVQAHGPGFRKILLGDDVVDQLGEVPRPDGRQHLPQQRPRLHQLLRHLGLAAHEGNRPGARREDRPDRSQAAGRPEGRPGRVHRPRPGRRPSGA